MRKHSKIVAMSKQPFSHFQYRTGSKTDFRIICESADCKSGRFWLGCIQTVRHLLVNAGQQLLGEFMDHHSQASEHAIDQFLTELASLPEPLRVVNSQFMPPFRGRKDMNLFQSESIGRVNGEQTCLSKLRGEQKAALASFDGWWLGWLEQSIPQIDWGQVQGDLVDKNLADYVAGEGLLLPHRPIQEQLSKGLKSQDFRAAEPLLRQLRDWLEGQGQWLEALRLDLRMKNFEAASYALESHGQEWQGEGSHALEQLFWLRELPSVLFSSRPILILKAARAASQLSLPLQTSYYLNLAEQQLVSLRRLARTDRDWLTITLDEDGHTVGQLLEIHENIKGGSQHGIKL